MITQKIHNYMSKRLSIKGKRKRTHGNKLETEELIVWTHGKLSRDFREVVGKAMKSHQQAIVYSEAGNSTAWGGCQGH